MTKNIEHVQKLIIKGCRKKKRPSCASAVVEFALSLSKVDIEVAYFHTNSNHE